MLKSKHFRAEAWDHYIVNLHDSELPPVSYRRGNAALAALSLAFLAGLVGLARSMPASALDVVSKKEPAVCVRASALPASSVVR